VSTPKHSVSVPEDMLVIYYADLSPDPSIRLQAVAAIGELLHSTGSIDLSKLVPSSECEQTLLAWLAEEDSGQFWQIDGRRITEKRPCERHILVGTKLLLQDLAGLEQEPRWQDLENVDLVWQAADRFLKQADHS
jgi:hypothetical protein